MNKNRQELINEAVRRFKLLKVSPIVPTILEVSDCVCRSYFGILKDLTIEQQQFISDFELETGHVVYHVIETDTTEGFKVTDYLYIDKNISNWVNDLERLEYNQIIERTVVSNSYDIETGYIGVKRSLAGLQRAY